jgi:Rrf2 family iron-sulfur cluster assembly transcriptional regulator
MEFGMKRVMASVQAVAVLTEIYGGAPVSIATISKKSKLSISYLEQIFKKLRHGKLVTSHRGRVADTASIVMIFQYQK